MMKKREAKLAFEAALAAAKTTRKPRTRTYREAFDLLWSAMADRKWEYASLEKRLATAERSINRLNQKVKKDG